MKEQNDIFEFIEYLWDNGEEFLAERIKLNMYITAYDNKKINELYKKFREVRK